MLPAKRCSEEPYAVPKFELNRSDIEGFLGELDAYLEPFDNCFSRQEPRDNLLKYLVGQYSSLERKSIEPIAQTVANGKVRALQQFISDIAWDDPQFRVLLHERITTEIGAEDGCLIIDESGFVKKGGFSAGVARQYCGNVGKVENAQVGVFMCYASREGYALADAQLYLPERWFTPEYAERLRRTQTPEDVTFRTKPEIAAAMVRQAWREQILPFKYILADSVYGENPAFIRACAECVGVTFLLAVSSDRVAYAQYPVTKRSGRRTKNGRPTTTVIVSSQKAAPLKTIAAALHDTFWYRRTVSEGTKGPIVYEFTRRKMWMALTGDGELTQVDLLIKRSVGSTRKYWFYICQAPSWFRLKHLVWLSGMRWAIEQSFEEGKSELGMDHYEVRKWPGWHHHMMVCMLGLLFLLHLMVRLEKKSCCAYFVPDSPVIPDGFTAPPANH